MKAFGCLYGILDFGYVTPADAVRVAGQMVEGGVDLLQIRAKELPESEIVEIARKVHPLTRQAGIPLILNDYPHLVPIVGAEGVHVGQDDLSVAEARRLAGGNAVIVGKSTHSVDQAMAAVSEQPDYLGFGPLFATPTKPDYRAIGLEHIAEVHQRIDLPIFCIGGIKLENLDSVLSAGARRVVIVSGILQAADIPAYVRKVKEPLRASSSGIQNPKLKI